MIKTDVECGPFAVCDGRKIASAIQRQLVPWLIAINGLQWKAVPMSTVREMIAALIDANEYLGTGVKCEAEAKRFPLGFADLVKKAKTAAGKILSIVLDQDVLLMRHPNRRKKFASASLHRASCPPTAI
jgi:hypothetical protein